MAQYGGSDSQLALPSVNEAVGILVPKVENLLRSVCHEEPVSAADGDGLAYDGRMNLVLRRRLMRPYRIRARPCRKGGVARSSLPGPGPSI